MESETEWFESVGYKIEIVKTGFCRANQKLGQKFLIDSYTTPEGLCIEALHSMYPLLFAGKINADFTLLGSNDIDQRTFTCPSKVVQYSIIRFYQCNNCGKETSKEELRRVSKTYKNLTLDILACPECIKNEFRK